MIESNDLAGRPEGGIGMPNPKADGESTGAQSKPWANQVSFPLPDMSLLSEWRSAATAARSVARLAINYIGWRGV